jgi:hypothetical protein
MCIHELQHQGIKVEAEIEKTVSHRASVVLSLEDFAKNDLNEKIRKRTPSSR